MSRTGRSMQAHASMHSAPSFLGCKAMGAEACQPTKGAPAVLRGLVLTACLLATSGCGVLPSSVASAESAPSGRTGSAQKPVPQPDPQGLSESAVRAFWTGFDDPLLMALIDSAHQTSASLATARGRIERARAERVAADAAWTPLAVAAGALSRGRNEPQLPLTQNANVGARLSWELDLFGAGRSQSAAGLARLTGAEHGLQVARLSLAADVGISYVGYRACEVRRGIAEEEVASQAQTVRASEVAAQAGLLPPHQAVLARAAASQAEAALRARITQCELLIQSIGTLTGVAPADLQVRLREPSRSVPRPKHPVPQSVPARLLTLRPDLQEAESLVASASFEEQSAVALQRPSLSLSGVLGQARVTGAPVTFDGSVWTLGPLQLSFPIYDGGVRQARVQAAQAGVEEAQSAYRARLRLAAQEAEEALINLRDTAEREHHARQAALGFGVALAAAQSRLRGGMGSVLEVEQSRRLAIAARTAIVDLQQAQTQAWIALHKALGGRWPGDDQRPGDAVVQAGQ